MRLVARFTLALVGAIVLVLAAGGALQVRHELDRVEADMARDQAALARMLRAQAESAVRRDGAAAARALVEAAGAAQRRVRVRWVALAPPEPGLRPAEARTLRAGRTVRRVADVGDGTPRRITVEPVMDAGRAVGAIALSEPLAPQRDAVRRTQLTVLASTTASVLACALVTLVVGAWLVGRPMHRLCEQARRVGAGDLSRRLPARRGDEIGLLSRALNRMVEQLADARDRVAAETRARIAALEQLRHADRLRTVGQLAAGVAHELGTPLGVAGARARMIATTPHDAAHVARNAAVVGEQVDRMTRIVRQLLDFSRRRPPALVAGDLGSLAAGTVELLSSLAAARRVRLHVGVPAAPVLAAIDRAQIEQALANLVVNAMQAAAPGGTVRVQVDACSAAPPPDHGGAPGTWCRLTVADDGCGMRPEHLRRLFEPFFTTKDVGQGTGLGLAVSWGIVREHGGWIEIESAVGRGTTARIVLPPANAAPPLAAAVA